MNNSKITWKEFKTDMSKVVVPALMDSVLDIFARAWSILSFKNLDDFLCFLLSLVIPAIGGLYFLTIMVRDNIGDIPTFGCLVMACMLLRAFNNGLEKRIVSCEEKLWESGNVLWTMAFWIVLVVLLKLYGHHIWGLEHVIVNPDKKYLALICLAMSFSFKSK